MSWDHINELNEARFAERDRLLEAREKAEWQARIAAVRRLKQRAMGREIPLRLVDEALIAAEQTR